MSGEVLTGVAYVRYEVDCPCGEVTSMEGDPTGEVVECDSCSVCIRILETR